MKIYDLIPPVYYNQSRDFSYIARLIEISFNYMKTGADSIGANLSKNSPGMLLDLAADTFGFEQKHEYNAADLAAIISIFYDLLRKKGSEAAIKEAILTLVSTQRISSALQSTLIGYDATDSSKIIIYVPAGLNDIVLLEDLFDYILPAGMLYSIIKTDDSAIPELSIQGSTTDDEAKGTIRSDADVGDVIVNYTAQNKYRAETLDVVVTNYSSNS